MSKLFFVLALAMVSVVSVQCGTYVKVDIYRSDPNCGLDGVPRATWYNGTSCYFAGGDYHSIFCDARGSPYGVVCTGSCRGTCLSIGTSNTRWGEMYCWGGSNIGGFGITCFQNSTSPVAAEPRPSSPRASTPATPSSPSPSPPSNTPSPSPPSNTPSASTPSNSPNVPQTASPTAASPRSSSAQPLLTVNVALATALAIVALGAL